MTMQERYDGIASIERAAGRLRLDASPAEVQAAVDAVLDDLDFTAEARATELEYRLGAGVRYPAAA
ncbi:hypothetical protein [Kitasatospora sp. NPDC086791]|uniref:hypothetical protein n=1 Tax=Kitasatospora sp. NPDC086791 TaxID=3155178 RepID=UPI0034180FA2